MVSNNALNKNALKRMTESSKVLVKHTTEQGKGDYIINPYYYFEKSIADDKQFMTDDRVEENGKITRVIYALNKDDMPFYNSYNVLRPLADDKYVSGRICIDCLNPIPPKKKNEFMGRLCCQECNKGNTRETINKNRIIKIDYLG
jgi:hypothetical protein